MTITTTEDFAQQVIDQYKYEKKREQTLITIRTEYMLYGDIHRYAKKLREISK